MTTKETAKKFFDAFQEKNHQVMASLYQENVAKIFSDPIFTELYTEQVRCMWKILLSSRDSDFSLSYRIDEIDEEKSLAQVSWTANYKFAATGRKIENSVKTELQVQDGKIILQTDRFDLGLWAKQAFPFFQSLVIRSFPEHTIQKQAMARLEKALLKERDL